MSRSRRQTSRLQGATENGGTNEPVLDEPTDTVEHVSDPHGTVAMSMLLLLMLLLVFLIIAIAQSV
jgi:hypothetical protein